MFYMMEGPITFHCGDETFDLEPGDFVFLLHGIQHGYTIRGTDPVRLIVVTSPVRDEVTGGWQGFVGDMESGKGKMIAKPPNIGGKYGIKIYRDSHR